MALRLEILELSGKVSRSAEYGHNRAYGVGTAGVPKRVGQGIFVTWAVPTPKRLVDWAVLGTCKRSSLLTQTYGKSAGMVWGSRDHVCDTQVLVYSRETSWSCDFWCAFLPRASRR